MQAIRSQTSSHSRGWTPSIVRRPTYGGTLKCASPEQCTWHAYKGVLVALRVSLLRHYTLDVVQWIMKRVQIVRAPRATHQLAALTMHLDAAELRSLDTCRRNLVLHCSAYLHQ